MALVGQWWLGTIGVPFPNIEAQVVDADDLPKSLPGKVLRSQVRELLAAEAL